MNQGDYRTNRRKKKVLLILIYSSEKAYKAPNKTMTNYAINLIWFTYDAANHKKKKMAKQRETASVEKIYC